MAACESNLEKLCKKRQIICREIHPKPASLSKKNFCDAKTNHHGIFAGVLLVKMSAPRISWFPGHMASAIKQIEQRIKVVDLVFHSGFVFLLFCIAVPMWRSLFPNLPHPNPLAFRSSKCATLASLSAPPAPTSSPCYATDATLLSSTSACVPRPKSEYVCPALVIYSVR